MANVYFEGGRAFQTWLSEALSSADLEGKSVRFQINDGQWLKYKIGEGQWSAPFAADEDPNR